MFRYLVAHLPAFRLERCGWVDQQPVALIAEEKSAMRVQCATSAARKGGIRPGMTAAEARAVLPALQVEELDADGEAADLHDLSRQLLRVSPGVATLPPDGLVAEISSVPGTGPAAATAGRERALLERVRIRLDQLGHDAAVVIADDPHTALACAVWDRTPAGRGRCRIVPPGQGAQALAGLPLAALGLPLREQDLLEGLGLHTVGAFAALPPASVVGRLSPVAVAAHALARGRGHRPVIPTWQQDDALVLSQDLMHPVAEQDALIFVLNALLRDAAAHLAAAGKAVNRVVLRLTLDPQEVDDDDAGLSGVPPVLAAAGGVQELNVRLGAPTRSAPHMLQLLRTRLDRVRLAGPVQAVAVELPGAHDFDGRQRDLLDHQRASEALADALARIQDELGADAVLIPRAIARHRPEAAWQAVPWQPRDEAPALLTARRPVAEAHADLLARGRPDGSDPVREWEGFTLDPAPTRPALLHHPPLAVDVRSTPAGPGLRPRPTRLFTDGRWVDLDASSGPEALRCEWWLRDLDRSYWRADLADGRRAWLYEEDGQWALHGWFD